MDMITLIEKFGSTGILAFVVYHMVTKITPALVHLTDAIKGLTKFKCPFESKNLTDALDTETDNAKIRGESEPVKPATVKRGESND